MSCDNYYIALLVMFVYLYNIKVTTASLNRSRSGIGMG